MTTANSLPRLFYCLALLLLGFFSTGCQLLERTKENKLAITTTSLDEQPPKMLSAFFGLDNSLPLIGALIWWKAPGKDGMPVTFSRRVVEPIDAAAFTVVTRSGERLNPLHATTVPADDAAERHTVLLIGELGDEPDDPPARVEITGSLKLDGGVNANGLSVVVTPLADGPSLVLAYATDVESQEHNYPAGTKQIVVVVWAGGVRKVAGVTSEDHRLGYTVTTTEGDTVPLALGDIGDGDNYEHLYLDTDAKPLSVSMKGGLLMDPRDDPNPATSVEVAVTINN